MLTGCLIATTKSRRPDFQPTVLNFWLDIIVVQMDYSAPNLRTVERSVSEEQLQLEKQVASLFEKELKVQTTDGRVFNGIFTCLDSEGNVVLQNCVCSGPSGC